MITINVKNTDRLFTSYLDRSLFLQMATIASRIVDAEGLILNYLMPKARLSRFSASGVCYTDKKEIAIAIRYRQDKQDGGEWDKQPIPFRELEKTLVHEIAHLKHPNHSKEFKQYEKYLYLKYIINNHKS